MPWAGSYSTQMYYSDRCPTRGESRYGVSEVDVGIEQDLMEIKATLKEILDRLKRPEV